MNEQTKGAPHRPQQRYTTRGEADKVQFRCPRALRLAVLSRAEAEGIDEREAWERAGREWADR